MRDDCGQVDWRDYITVDPHKLGGKATVRGMRIGVVHVLEYLASGMTVEEILEDFPELTRNDVLACLAFAAEREQTATTATP
jgi:uncharacterized protein (DUF433 family)